MLFNSIPFMIFLPLVFAVYWLMGSKRIWQNRFLLIASYVFYGWWDWRYLLLIVGCSFVNYLAGGIIYRSSSKYVKRCALLACCCVCFGVLGVFKYYNFFIESFVYLFQPLFPKISSTDFTLNLILPVGISFFTFQALSYTIDIMYGRLKPANDWVEFFVFISFFPQLVAGPIERATNLLPQFQCARKFNFDKATQGLCLMAYGLFKKIVVADVLAVYVDSAYKHVEFYTTITCILAAIFFSFQIYCDFSGYSDVARGVAKLFGFELMLNFDRPYLSTSFSEFWRHWHISLSTWFKDYVYIPLGGNRVGMWRLICNLWIVFILSGLWHGAAWTFVAWGALHALFLTLGIFKRKYCPFFVAKTFIGKIFAGIFVYVGVCVAWILFRAGDMTTLKRFVGTLISGDFSISNITLFAGCGPLGFAFCILAIVLLWLSYLVPRDCNIKSLAGKFTFTICCLIAIIFLGMPSGGEFIYFRF